MEQSLAIELAERAWVPDTLLRAGIRATLRRRLAEQAGAPEAPVEVMRRSPIAALPDCANAQHYEVPADWFEHVLGPHLKYSCAWWNRETADLAAAETAMLDTSCRRAEIADGMQVLDLGCGWGSLALWIAEHYPRAGVVAVSNSATQRDTIEKRAAARGLRNLEVVTADVNSFDPGGAGRFDRVVSIEMFEHLRNWEAMLERVATWLRPGGKVFLHYFCHRTHSYFYEDRGASDWMARHFFSGGMMPSAGLVRELKTPFRVEESWSVSGTHYQATAEAWLRRLDRNRAAARETLVRAVAPRDLDRVLQRWRIFFLACAELFGFRGGDEWFVAHHRLALPGARGSS